MFDLVELILVLLWSFFDLFVWIEEFDVEEVFLVWLGEVGEIFLCYYWEVYCLVGILNCCKYNWVKLIIEWGNNKGIFYKVFIGFFNDVFVVCIVVYLDVLLEINRWVVYFNYLMMNVVFFFYVVVWFEVVVLFWYGYFMDFLCCIKVLVFVYVVIENFWVFEIMLDEVYEI